MRNYESRFQLPNGKWAYIQALALAQAAADNIRQIKHRWEYPDYFYHFKSGGHVAALKLHQPNSWYAMIDLAGFFNSVTRHKVARSLKNLGYTYCRADEFAVASTVRICRRKKRFVLPYGFVQSPILASVALDMSALGCSLRKLHGLGLTISVYVDDILVSAESEADTAAALADLRDAANRSNFDINEEKSDGPTQSLTAFNIDLDESRMGISRARFEEMCREVLRSGSGNVSQGILGYVRSVSTAQADHMINQFPRSFPNV